MWTRPIAIVNARVVTPGGIASSIRFDERVLATGERPRTGDVVVDVEGAFVLPGLINAHDHLELNHYGRIKHRERYSNVSEWIADMQRRLGRDPRIRAGRALPLGARLFAGALKNLLAGVTTVAHHNPHYREIGRGIPIRVVRRYGWAHSFELETRPAGANGEPGGDMRARYRATPASAPFIVHVGEGIDGAARTELPRLEALGCLGGNTIVVHGVALGERDWRDVVRRGAGLVWCPASNDFLFGRTAAVRSFLDASPVRTVSRICLGTDSRLTGARDLLDELRAARDLAPVSPSELLLMVTTAAADLLRLDDVGRLVRGARADLAVIEPRHAGAAESLLAASRGDLILVTVGGVPMVGKRSIERAFGARGEPARAARIDGRPALLAPAIARAIERCPIAEAGVACLN